MSDMMIPDTARYSVNEVAAICGVGRSTVTYWIRNRGLNAVRHGKAYTVSTADLQAFLPSVGRSLPAGETSNRQAHPVFRPLVQCRQYWQGTEHGKHCPDCIVFANHISTCFIARRNGKLRCRVPCADCRHYLEIYRPRINLIYQLAFPAAVYQELHFWGANRHLENLCEIDTMGSVGMGIEEIIHSDSLGDILNHNRKQKLGEPAPASRSITLKTITGGNMRTMVSIYPLSRGENTSLIICTP